MMDIEKCKFTASTTVYEGGSEHVQRIRREHLAHEIMGNFVGKNVVGTPTENGQALELTQTLYVMTEAELRHYVHQSLIRAQSDPLYKDEIIRRDRYAAQRLGKIPVIGGSNHGKYIDKQASDLVQMIMDTRDAPPPSLDTLDDRIEVQQMHTEYYTYQRVELFERSVMAYVKQGVEDQTVITLARSMGLL